MSKLLPFPNPKMHIQIAGKCPMGCGESLFLAEGNRIFCGQATCPNPGAIDEWLRNPSVLKKVYDTEAEHAPLTA